VEEVRLKEGDKRSRRHGCPTGWKKVARKRTSRKDEGTLGQCGANEWRRQIGAQGKGETFLHGRESGTPWRYAPQKDEIDDEKPVRRKTPWLGREQTSSPDRGIQERGGGGKGEGMSQREESLMPLPGNFGVGVLERRAGAGKGSMEEMGESSYPHFCGEKGRLCLRPEEGGPRLRCQVRKKKRPAVSQLQGGDMLRRRT